MRLPALRRASLAAFALVPFLAMSEATAFARPLSVAPTPPPSLVLVLDAPAEAPGAPATPDATASLVAPDLPIRPPAQRTGAIGKLAILVLALVGLIVLVAIGIVVVILFDLTSNEI